MIRASYKEKNKVSQNWQKTGKLLKIAPSPKSVKISEHSWHFCVSVCVYADRKYFIKVG